MPKQTHGKLLPIVNDHLGTPHEMFDEEEGWGVLRDEDPGGRVIETKKPDGVRLVYGYDKTDKLTSIKSYAADASATDPPLDETHYWYDRRGLMIKASNQAALVELVRDGNGRIVRETVNGRAIESALDARGNRVDRAEARRTGAGGGARRNQDLDLADTAERRERRGYAPADRRNTLLLGHRRDR